MKLLPWQQPVEEITERIVLPVDEMVAVMDIDWPGLATFSQELLDLALDALPDI